MRSIPNGAHGKGRVAQALPGIEEFAANAPPTYRSYYCAVAAVRAALGDYSGLLLFPFNTHPECAADRALGQVLAVQGRLDEACACPSTRLRSKRASRPGRWRCAPATGGRARWRSAAPRAIASRRALLDACLEKARAFGMLHLTEQAEALTARVTAG